MARSIGGTFRRLQCTPDLLPSDVTGVSVFDQRTSQFEFRPGPIFANVLLADEINRATPRTQSAVLEAMQEAQVSVDGVTRPLPRPFVVLATQNPVELEGTFPLPEAQLDRFLMRISLGYPSQDDEEALVARGFAASAEVLGAVVAADEVLSAVAEAAHVRLHDDVRR
jgi:MoxR-like ATPase